VVAFKGPHINHLTPRTLDIDQVQAPCPARASPQSRDRRPAAPPLPDPVAPDQLQGPRRAIAFTDAQGSHSARFGEIEQRGVALTPKGRALYDQLLNAARDELGAFPTKATPRVIWH
jgi:uncharacterized glyoxalase superfamily metalloenzyme YdcJ